MGKVPRADLGRRLAAVACKSAAQCCQADGKPFDETGCQRELTEEFQSNIDDIGDSSVEYDADAAGECIDGIAAIARCGDFEEDDSPACDRVFRGKVAAGQPCADSIECQSQNGIRMSCTTGSTGVYRCTPYEPAAHGKLEQACDFTCFEGQTCLIYSDPSLPGGDLRTACYRDEGLFCGTGSCRPLSALGDGCNDSSQCAGSAFCDFGAARCISPKPDGAACTSGIECLSEWCTGDDAAGAPGTEAVAQHCSSRDVELDPDLCSEEFDESTL